MNNLKFILDIVIIGLTTVCWLGATLMVVGWQDTRFLPLMLFLPFWGLFYFRIR